jgi:glycosyltransferase involved in cell wall biosynthesis
MRWFLDDVYEPLEKQGIKLTIAGSEIPDFMYEYKKKFSSLEIMPDVSTATLEALYTQTRIAIVPLKVGAGVKGKVIEAMAKGVPVVGTDRAFEGLLKNDGFLYHGYNTAAELIENIALTYHNQQQWESLSAFGKNYVKEHFNKENMKQVFKKIIN